MRRAILFAAVAVLVLAVLGPAASAGEPNATHERVEFAYTEVDTKTCDFDFRETASGWFNWTVVGESPRLEVVAGGEVLVVHENLETGYTLTEKDVWSDVYLYEKNLIIEAGLVWHLRDPEGRIILVQAGRLTYDLEMNILTFTPQRAMRFADIICSALTPPAS